MRLYRIGRQAYLEDYRGLGASYLDGGRWNAASVPALYFAETASVAMLEMANYLPSPRLVPTSYRLGVFEVPEDTAVDRWPVADLPVDWGDFPYPKSTQEMGTNWLAGAVAPFLEVPSAAVPGGIEHIVLASPVRLGAMAIRLVDVQANIYNPRAFGGAPGATGR